MNIFKRKCDNCGKKLGLFEKTHTWFGDSSQKLKYCEDCHRKGIPKNKEKPKEKEIKEGKGPGSYICNECDKKIPAGSWDGHFCVRCGQWYCSEHFKSHHCQPKGPRRKAVVAKEKKCKGYCDFCRVQMTSDVGYFCKFCEKWFCEKHRLPEDHKCKGEPSAKALGPRPTPESLKHSK